MDCSAIYTGKDQADAAARELSAELNLFSVFICLIFHYFRVFCIKLFI